MQHSPPSATVTHLAKKFHTILMEHKGSLPCSQEHATASNPVPDESHPQTPIPFFVG